MNCTRMCGWRFLCDKEHVKLCTLNTADAKLSLIRKHMRKAEIRVVEK